MTAPRVPNVGEGSELQRIAAALAGMVHSRNPVTRWSCRMIVATKLARGEARGDVA